MRLSSVSDAISGDPMNLRNLLDYGSLLEYGPERETILRVCAAAELYKEETGRIRSARRTSEEITCHLQRKRPGSEVFSFSTPWLGSWTSGGSHQWRVGW